VTDEIESASMEEGASFCTIKIQKETSRMDRETVFKIKRYLEDNKIANINGKDSKMDLRAQGRKFPLTEHIQGMIYSLLSAQTVWANIERNMPRIDELFFYYAPEMILSKDYTYFVDGLARLRCRSRLTNNQMKSLPANIRMMQKIENEYGSMDAFVTSRPQSEIVHLLADSGSRYKMKQMGEALAWEYLRNVGVDGAKPDVHMKRILGSERLGVSKSPEASNEEVISTMKKLSDETGIWMAQLDYLFWCYCATDKGEICTAEPDCNRCVIKDECNRFR
jgi:endonuclease III